jgi:Xaa-Pro aminopeptidase
MVKTPAEIQLLQHAGTVTEKAIQCAFELAHPGAEATGVAREIGCLLTRLGAEQVAFVQLDVLRDGRRLGYGRRPVHLMEGDWIRVDAGGYFSGYYSDVARMAVVGSPSPEQLSTYKRLLAVQKAIIQDVVRPGVPGSELFLEISETFEEAGFDTPWGVIVHGIGLHIHERPWIREQESHDLPPGSVHCVEAISHGPAEEMWHIEDLVVVTEDGSRELTTYADTDDPFMIS